jgi:hypothetical protein
VSEAQQLDDFKKKYNFKNQAEAQAKLLQIREQRKQLRTKLDQF